MIPLCFLDDSLSAQARHLAKELDLSLDQDNKIESDYKLQLGLDGLSLVNNNHKKNTSIKIDFCQGQTQHRLKFGGGLGQPLVKACNIKEKHKPTILDVTAGMGKDAFVLASHGANVLLCERNPMIHALLYDGLKRAQHCDDIDLIIQRMTLIHADAVTYLLKLSEQHDPDVIYPDVIYIDPMYPKNKNSALPNKAMQFFQTILGDDLDSDDLLDAALTRAQQRVVVKRPLKATPIAGKKPDFSYPSKNTRFDVYQMR
ncbi:MAG: class I SAM-dependent methyltransferase [Gammaproteobacteria bacterium]|nr:class I SAM-dependent methyltransferase [Gammaproteobacteria bacterium]